jgi:hypothetical protein
MDESPMIPFKVEDVVKIEPAVREDGTVLFYQVKDRQTGALLGQVEKVAPRQWKRARTMAPYGTQVFPTQSAAAFDFAMSAVRSWHYEERLTDQDLLKIDNALAWFATTKKRMQDEDVLYDRLVAAGLNDAEASAWLDAVAEGS